MTIVDILLSLRRAHQLVFSHALNFVHESKLHTVIYCSVQGTLTISVFCADLGDDLHVFLHLPLEALLSDASAM